MFHSYIWIDTTKSAILWICWALHFTYSILFYSILYFILQAAPCSSTSIFACLWFCVRDLFHQDPHYRFDWILLSLMHTVFLSLTLSLFFSLSFFFSLSVFQFLFPPLLLFSSQAFIVSLHFPGIKNVWIIQPRASSVSKNCMPALKMMTIQNGSRQTLIPLP